MPQDHERATGLWHAEWLPLVELCKISAGALDQALILTNGLEVDTERMRQNLELTHGLIFAENISLALADKVGKATAHEWVEAFCQTASATHTHLKSIVLADSRIQALLSKTEIDHLFEPANALGDCDRFIDNILATF